jgi:group I intron endonuclease
VLATLPQERLYKYFSVNHLRACAKKKSPIYNALLKYGFDKFTFEVLEYCVDIDPVVREQYYFSVLKPEYNILEHAGSSLGYKHSRTTLEFFKNERKVTEETRKNLSLAATGRVLTEEDKQKISDARKGITLSQETRSKISSAAIALRGIAVSVKNMNTDEELEFTNLTEAAKHIGVSRPAVKKYSDTGKLIQGKYLVRTK